MSTGTLDDTLAPRFEVRIYRDDELVLQAFCESPEEATAVASQGSGLDHVYLLVDDGAPTQGPGDVFTHDQTTPPDEENQPLAAIPLPGYGTE
jgi:hypothetical protein